MRIKMLLPLMFLTAFAACTELESMVDIKELLSGQDCSLPSFEVSSDKTSSIPELDNIPYLKMVESLGEPSTSSRDDFGSFNGSDGILPEFYLPLMFRLREVPIGETLTIEEKTWIVKGNCMLTIWYEVSGETLKSIANLYYDATTDF